MKGPRVVFRKGAALTGSRAPVFQDLGGHGGAAGQVPGGVLRQGAAGVAGRALPPAGGPVLQRRGLCPRAGVRAARLLGPRLLPASSRFPGPHPPLPGPESGFSLISQSLPFPRGSGRRQPKTGPLRILEAPAAVSSDPCTGCRVHGKCWRGGVSQALWARGFQQTPPQTSPAWQWVWGCGVEEHRACT